MRTPRLVLALSLALGGAACSGVEAPPLVADGRPDGDGRPAASVDQADGAAARRIDPRRGGLELGFGEFAITLEAGEIRPGPVTFVVRNGGRLVHGFEIEIEEDGDHSGHGGNDDDDGFKWEGEPFGPGETVRIDARLVPGVYKIECFIEGHDDLGMEAMLVVRRGAPLIPVERRSNRDTIEIADFAFSPTQVEIPVGTELTWSNADPTAHTVTADGGAFDSGTLEPGSVFSTRFTQVGVFDYVCQIHPTMRGTIRVV